jgi:hypothetical protein
MDHFACSNFKNDAIAAQKCAPGILYLMEYVKMYATYNNLKPLAAGGFKAIYC